MIIKVKNTQTVEAPMSFLANSPAAAGTALIVKNISGFANGWYSQVGETNGEKTEIKAVNGAPSGSVVPVAALSFTHPIDTPVYSIKYDQIVFKVSTTGTAGTAVAITNGTVSITPDWDFTQFDHTAGSASYAYKTCYRDSVGGAVSPDSGWLTSGGYSQYSLAHMRNRVRSKLSNNTDVKDEDIDIWLNEWLETMNNAAVSVNQGYSEGTTTVSFSGTAQEGAITDSDFKYVEKVEYTEDGVNHYVANKTEWQAIHPTDIYSNTRPFYYVRGENILGRLPHSNNGTATVTYYKMQTQLNDDTDELPNPMKSYSNSFVKWATGQARRIDKEYQVATELEIGALNDLEKFKQEISPRNKGGPQYIEFVTDMGGEDDIFY
jgi:hypothetical protein